MTAIYDRKDIRDMAKWLPYKLVMAFHRLDLLTDLRQDFWEKAIRLDPDIDGALAYTIIKHDLIEKLRSREYNWSYGNKKPVIYLGNNPLNGNFPSNDRDEQTLAKQFVVGGRQSDVTIANDIFERFDERRQTLMILVWVQGWSTKRAGQEYGIGHSMVSKILNSIRKEILEREATNAPKC